MARPLHGQMAATIAAILAVALVVAGTPAGERPARPEAALAPGQRLDMRPVLAPGQMAPDFGLARLTLETDKSGNVTGKIATEKVKLSSLRGQKPVCLFFSSYT